MPPTPPAPRAIHSKRSAARIGGLRRRRNPICSAFGRHDELFAAEAIPAPSHYTRPPAPGAPPRARTGLPWPPAHPFHPPHTLWSPPQPPEAPALPPGAPVYHPPREAGEMCGARVAPWPQPPLAAPRHKPNQPPLPTHPTQAGGRPRCPPCPKQLAGRSRVGWGTGRRFLNRPLRCATAQVVARRGWERPRECHARRSTRARGSSPAPAEA
eukprot:scaffold20662_cov101-Isochrysis_galbana.AAC.2